MLWPVVCSCAYAAISALWPIPSRPAIIFSSDPRPRQAQRAMDRALELVGVGRIGCIAGALQSLCEALDRLRLAQNGAVACARRHQRRPVAKRLGVRTV